MQRRQAQTDIIRDGYQLYTCSTDNTNTRLQSKLAGVTQPSQRCFQLLDETRKRSRHEIFIRPTNRPAVHRSSSVTGFFWATSWCRRVLNMDERTWNDIKSPCALESIHSFTRLNNWVCVSAHSTERVLFHNELCILLVWNFIQPVGGFVFLWPC